MVAFVSGVQADDKNDPTGTWKWTPAAGGGGGGKKGGAPREVTLKLKLDGDKLTGSMPGRGDTETKIEDGTFKNGEVTFKITRERNGNKTVMTYKAKVDGDKMTGTIDRGQGEPTKFEAKRSKD
ncbi:MAG: hypothetical protein QM703_01440 [Gemmatales bacterium]